MNEINMVPFIDVMLVLLIIFMVSAPLITVGVVDVPSVGKAKVRPAHVIEVSLDAQSRLLLKLDREEARPIDRPQLARAVLAAQAGSADTPVIISADRQVRYEEVVRIMDTLQRAGVQRVGLTVKQGQ